MKAPWLNPRGEFSPLKASAFVLLFVPGLVLCWRLVADGLGPRPTEALVHQSGLWAIRFLLLSLAVTPVRAAWRWPELARARRMLGVAAFAYAAMHLGAYAADQAWNVAKVAWEIWLRTYLTIGFVTLMLLLALAATSFDAAVRWLGGVRWRRLHRGAYVAAALACVHFFLQSRVGMTEPIVMAASALWLGAWRIGDRRVTSLDMRSPGLLATLSGAAVAATGLAEAACYHLTLGAPLAMVLRANLMIGPGIRPAWIMLGLGAIIFCGSLARTAISTRQTAAQ